MINSVGLISTRARFTFCSSSPTASVSTVSLESMGYSKADWDKIQAIT